MTNEDAVKQLQAEEPLSMRLDDYDFKECMKYAPFKDEDIQELIAEYPGEADGENWHYIVKLKDEKIGWVTAGCDYTGWGCQEWGEGRILATIDEALNMAENESYDKEKGKIVRSCLYSQIFNGKPYALK